MKNVRKRYLLMLALAGVLVFGNVPVMTASAMSNQGQGAVVGDEASDAGDVMDVGENDIPLGAGEGSGSGTEVNDDNVPLATLSTQTQAGGFSWWGFILGLCVGIVGEAVVWIVLGKKKKQAK